MLIFFTCCLSKVKMINTLKEFQNQNCYYYYQPLKLSESKSTSSSSYSSEEDEMKQYKDDVESFIQINEKDERRKSQKEEERGESSLKEPDIDTDAKIRERSSEQIIKDKEMPLGVTEYDLKTEIRETKPQQKKIEIFNDEIVSRDDDEVKKKPEKQKEMEFPEKKIDDYYETKIASEADDKSSETKNLESEKNSQISSESSTTKNNEKRKKKSIFKSSKKKMQTSSGESDMQDDKAAGPSIRRLSRWMQRIFKPSKSETNDKETRENKGSSQPSTSGSSRSPSEVDKKISHKTGQEKRSKEKHVVTLPKTIISESGLPLRSTSPSTKANILKKKAVASDDFKKIDNMLMQSDLDKLFRSSRNDLKSGKQYKSLQPYKRYSKKRSVDSLLDVIERSASENESASESSSKGTSDYN